jgi:hypothetical protein
MIIFSTPEFKTEFEKLIKKNSYKYLSKSIIECYFDKTIEECLSGTKLNGHSKNPFIKKRIGASGGSRLYLLAIVTNDKLYFSFVHPKSGSEGYENISDEKRNKILKETLDCIDMNDLFEITCCENKEVLNFDRPKKQKPIMV